MEIGLTRATAQYAALCRGVSNIPYWSSDSAKMKVRIYRQVPMAPLQTHRSLLLWYQRDVCRQWIYESFLRVSASVNYLPYQRRSCKALGPACIRARTAFIRQVRNSDEFLSFSPFKLTILNSWLLSRQVRSANRILLGTRMITSHLEAHAHSRKILKLFIKYFE